MQMFFSNICWKHHPQTMRHANEFNKHNYDDLKFWPVFLFKASRDNSQQYWCKTKIDKSEDIIEEEVFDKYRVTSVLY